MPVDIGDHVRVAGPDELDRAAVSCDVLQEVLVDAHTPVHRHTQLHLQLRGAVRVLQTPVTGEPDQRQLEIERVGAVLPLVAGARQGLVAAMARCTRSSLVAADSVRGLASPSANSSSSWRSVNISWTSSSVSGVAIVFLPGC